MNKKEAWLLLRSLLGGRCLGLRMMAWMNWRQNRKRLYAGPRTDICIEGYPRCANTFAVLAFESAQSQPLNIAHHTHLSGQILYSIRYGIPSIVLIRNPLDAAVSLKVREPSLTEHTCLKLYYDFYAPILQRKKDLVIASFETVIHDFGKVIKEVNALYGTNYGVYVSGDSENEEIMTKISSLPADENQFTVSRPTEEKRSRKEEILPFFHQGAAANLLRRCDAVYDELMQFSI